MDKFLTFTVSGLSLASIYAVAASGLVVTYTTSGIFNFAHGAFGMIGAFTYWQLQASETFGGWGVPTVLSLVLVVGILAPLFGALVERVIMRGLDGAGEVVKIVVTVSLMLALLGVANVVWPPNTARPLSNFWQGQSVDIFGVNVTYHRLLIMGIAALVAVLLRLVLYRTRAGVAMRATVDDRALLQLNGGRPHRSAMIAWAMGASLAAIAGILVASDFGLNSLTLTLLVINAYAAAVFGKLRSLPMTFLGALILGLAEAYVGGYVDSNTTIGGYDLLGLKFSVPAILLFAVMVFQPQVRLRAQGIQRVQEKWAVPTMKEAAFGFAALTVVVWALTGLLPNDSDLVPVRVAFFFALVALSLVPLTGYAGQISLAQLTFAGVGAVTMSAIGTDGSTLAGLIVAVGVCAALGALVAIPALRLTGLYLALATAAFTLLMTQMFFNQSKVLPGGTRQVPRLDLGIVAVESNRGQIVATTVAFSLVGLFLIWLRRNSLGRRLTAMKDSPVACATLGLDLTRTKIGVFALSAAIAGLGGALMGQTVQATNFELTSSMAVTMLAVVGGIGAVSGAFLGGMFLGVFQGGFVSRTFGDNAVGLFNFFDISVEDLAQFTPGFMGISLGREPSGAIPQIGAAYRGVLERREALGIFIGSGALLWLLARTDTITNWTFVVTLTVFVLGVVPLLPVWLEPIPGGRALAAGMVQTVGLVAVAAVDWEEAIPSNGMRVVAMFAMAIALAGVAVAVHGKVPRTGPPPAPSPDLLGIDRPLSRSDVMDAERALGIREGDIHGTARN